VCVRRSRRPRAAPSGGPSHAGNRRRRHSTRISFGCFQTRANVCRVGTVAKCQPRTHVARHTSVRLSNSGWADSAAKPIDGPTGETRWFLPGKAGCSPILGKNPTRSEGRCCAIAAEAPRTTLEHPSGCLTATMKTLAPALRSARESFWCRPIILCRDRRREFSAHARQLRFWRTRRSSCHSRTR
jgi:hypothetical protein